MNLLRLKSVPFRFNPILSSLYPIFVSSTFILHFFLNLLTIFLPSDVIFTGTRCFSNSNNGRGPGSASGTVNKTLLKTRKHAPQREQPALTIFPDIYAEPQSKTKTNKQTIKKGNKNPSINSRINQNIQAEYIDVIDKKTLVEVHAKKPTQNLNETKIDDGPKPAKEVSIL